MGNQERCETCRFAMSSDYWIEHGSFHLYCTRRAPQQSPHGSASWPMVLPEWRCGKWKAIGPNMTTEEFSVVGTPLF